MSKTSKNSEKKGVPFVLNRTFWIIIVAILGGIVTYQWNIFSNAGPHAAEIRDFIGNYFKTWSGKDMEGYAACFDPSAMVYFIRDGEVILRENKPDFIAGQSEALRTAPVATEEHAEAMDIITEGDVAYVRVHWKMTKGDIVKRGYDHFILLHQARSWRIISLSFYETKS